MSGRTPYAETEALLYVMEDDIENAMRVINSLTRNELFAFRSQVFELRRLIERTLGLYVLEFKD
jgi:hypothetical protein